MVQRAILRRNQNKTGRGAKLANVDFEHGQEVGRYHALKEVKDMITNNRADIDDIYLFCRNETQEYEEKRDNYLE